MFVSLNYSRITELKNVEENSGLGGGEAEKSQNNVADELERRISCIFLEYSSHLRLFDSEDFDGILVQLLEELSEVEAHNANFECEIEKLERSCMEVYGKMENELEKLCCSLEVITPQAPENAKDNMEISAPCAADDQTSLSDDSFSIFKVLELSHQIEKSRTHLKSLQELDSIFERFELVEKMEDALTGLCVVEVERNRMRISLKTYIPYLDSILRHHDIENVIEPLEMNHELIIETIDGTCELKNVEIFPDDVYIGGIFDSAKKLRQLYPTFSVIRTMHSLEFFLRRVMDRIAFSSVRQFLAKNANQARQSFEYVDREERIVAHLVGDVDALIKLPQGWPLSEQALELLSLKSTRQCSKETSLGFLYETVQAANSLNQHVRQNIKSFADSIEEILTREFRIPSVVPA